MSEGKTSEEEKAYWNVLSYMDILGYTLEIPKANTLDPELYNMKEWGKNIMEESSFPKWKEELLLNGYANLDERVEEIKKNGENHQMLPIGMSGTDNSVWLRFLFATNGPLGLLWGVSFVLAGIAAARSLGGSLMNNLQEMVYTGKTGRRLVWRKLLAVLVVSAGVYILLYLIMTIFCVFLFRLDLYWNVPLASMVYFGNSTIPRFAIYHWWLLVVPTGRGIGSCAHYDTDFLCIHAPYQELLCRFRNFCWRFPAAIGDDSDGTGTAVFFVPHRQSHWSVFTGRTLFAGEALPVLHTAPF